MLVEMIIFPKNRKKHAFVGHVNGQLGLKLTNSQGFWARPLALVTQRGPSFLQKLPHNMAVLKWENIILLDFNLLHSFEKFYTFKNGVQLLYLQRTSTFEFKGHSFHPFHLSTDPPPPRNGGPWVRVPHPSEESSFNEVTLVDPTPPCRHPRTSNKCGKCILCFELVVEPPPTHLKKYAPVVKMDEHSPVSNDWQSQDWKNGGNLQNAGADVNSTIRSFRTLETLHFSPIKEGFLKPEPHSLLRAISERDLCPLMIHINYIFRYLVSYVSSVPIRKL